MLLYGKAADPSIMSAVALLELPINDRRIPVMKRALIILVACALLPSYAAFAQDAKPDAKPDCSAQKTAYDDAAKATKVKADLTACKEMKGKEKTDCETPLKDKAKEDTKVAKEKAAEAKKALGCCQNPKKKGCS